MSRNPSVGRVLVVAAELDDIARLNATLGAAGYEVEHAFNGDRGLKKVAAARFDALVLDDDLPRHGARRVVRELRYHDAVPYVLLAEDLLPEERVRAFEEGAADVAQKPFDAEEVRVRIDRIVRGTAKAGPASRPARTNGVPHVEGRLDAFTSSDLLQLFQVSGKSGVLRIETHGRSGVLTVRHGQVIDASLQREPHVPAHDAFQQIVAWREGTFTCRLGLVTRPPRIRAATPLLLLEALRRQDESRSAKTA